MPIDKTRLQIALSTFHDENGELSCMSQFMNLYGDIYVNLDRIKNGGVISSNFIYLLEDYYILETLISRLSEQKELNTKKQIPDILWMLYASCDIELFHVTLRSLFDYIIIIIRSVANTPNIGPKSFEKYRNWANRSEENTRKVGQDIVDLMNSCDWFTDIRASRTKIVHDGGHTSVFPDPEKILFQIHAGIRNSIFIPELMFNENIVNFEKYAGMLFGYLIAYFESFADVIGKRLALTPKRVGNAKHLHFGHSIIRHWIQKAYST